MNKKKLLIITEQPSLLKDIQNIQNSAFNFVKKYYLETHRFYHTTKHIKSMCFELNKFDTSLNNKFIIYLAIMFHDVVYNTKDKDENNVINSSIMFLKWYEENKIYIETTFGCFSQDIDKCLLKDIINNEPIKNWAHLNLCKKINKNKFNKFIFTNEQRKNLHRSLKRNNFLLHRTFKYIGKNHISNRRFIIADHPFLHII